MIRNVASTIRQGSSASKREGPHRARRVQSCGALLAVARRIEGRLSTRARQKVTHGAARARLEVEIAQDPAPAIVRQV
jgi:hypothetical protein